MLTAAFGGGGGAGARRGAGTDAISRRGCEIGRAVAGRVPPA
jgi:hypothetical protein